MPGAYFSCGAKLASTGERIKSKTQLRDLLSNDPGDVFFDATDAEWFPTGKLEGFRGSELREHYSPIMVVTGPDPYQQRRWHAMVQRKGDKLVVA